MKILTYSVLFIFLFTGFACSDSSDDMVTATIEGYDLRLCACCGGLIVKPSDANGDTYQWYQKNEKFDVNENDVFPLKVKINYHHLAETCVASDGEIEITALEKVK
ncbi:MAG: hypothetical protein IPN86_11630 [Saprospiraceae bacterium]|nr:hypothetical protein [Saprospiraceae bacterium]